MNCALGKNELDVAKTVFYDLPDQARNEPETRYLLHKAAIRSEDEDLAAECLEHIAKAKDDRLLYACAVDAVASANKMCALKALRKLALKYDFGPRKVHLPALLRCTLRTNMSLLKSEGKDMADSESQGMLVECLCETFERGKSY